jgi:glycosyltransferase involved in cell wall biosynthesis
VLLLGLIERFGYRKADLVVGTMPRLDAHVRETIGNDRPFHCSPLGFAPEWAADETPLSEEFLQRYFPEGRIVVGYAGSMGITNALEPLMRCIERLSARTDIHFVLVGSGDLRDTYMARLSGLATVSFVPRIARGEVPSFLRRCDVLYLAAHDSPVWRFGQSMNKMVDYMLAGRPVVASYSGYQSMLNEANAGVVVDAGDPEALTEAIARMAEMPAEARAEMGARGRAWMLAHRSYAVLAREYLSALEQYVQRKA